MRVLWISTIDLNQDRGGGGTYSRGLIRVAGEAMPGAEIVILHPTIAPLRHRPRQVWSVVRACVSRRSAKLIFDLPTGLAERVREASKDTPVSLAVFDGSSAAQYAPMLAPGTPSIIIMHNLESDLYRRQIEQAPLPVRLLLGPILRDAAKHRRFERRVLERCAGIVCISADERPAILALAHRPTLPTAVILPMFFGAAGERAPSRQSQTLRLGFVGKMRWQPNREGLEWLLTRVWQPQPGIELHLYGEGSDAWHRPDIGIVAHGYVADIAQAWREMDVLLNPVLGGGGVNVKVCEALWHGVPVISTGHGLRGIGQDDPAVVLAEGTEGWRQALAPDALAALARLNPAPETRALFSPNHAVAEWSRLTAEVLGNQEDTHGR